jgi:hypothetical protein
VKGYTVKELAVRWKVPEKIAAEWLESFARVGLVDDDDGYWSASRLARVTFLGHGDE